MKRYFKVEEWERDYEISTWDLKLISQYTGLNFNEVYDLPYGLYLLYLKESWINNLKQTDEGKQFLKDLWRLQQTKADLNSIRSFTNRNGGE